MNNLAMLSGNQATSLAPDIANPSALPHSVILIQIEKDTMCVTPCHITACCASSHRPFAPTYAEAQSLCLPRDSMQSNIAHSIWNWKWNWQGGKEGLRKLVASAFAMWAKLAAQSKEGGGGGMMRQGAKEKEGGLPTEIDVYCSDFKAGKQVMGIQSIRFASWQLDVARALSSPAVTRWS